MKHEAGRDPSTAAGESRYLVALAMRRSDLQRVRTEKARIKLLRSHIVPTVIGPKGGHYIVDHHHFVRALVEEKAFHVGVYVLDDLSYLRRGDFWTVLDITNTGIQAAH